MGIITEVTLIYAHFPYTVEPRFNEPLYNEVLDITNDILQPDLLKCMEKDLDITNPRYNEPISLVPWHFVKSRFHCITEL